MTEDEFLKATGENIRKIRLKKDISLEKVAEKTHLNIEYLKKIEAGKVKRLKVSHFVMIAQALNIKPSELAEGL